MIALQNGRRAIEGRNAFGPHDAEAHHPYDARMFGSHLSVSGDMYSALLQAEKLGAERAQVFTMDGQHAQAAVGSGESSIIMSVFAVTVVGAMALRVAYALFVETRPPGRLGSPKKKRFFYLALLILVFCFLIAALVVLVRGVVKKIG